MRNVSLIALFLLAGCAHQTGSVGSHRAIAKSAPRVFLLDGPQLQATRQRVRHGDPALAPALAELKRDAREMLSQKPYSVVDKNAAPPSGDKHDYMSLAPYFWPNPDTTNGLPYVRHDGERNPEIYRISDHLSLTNMANAVETLALAYYFTGDKVYATKAIQFIRVWFLDPATRMNPHLQYAQAIPGVNTGRGIGIIETRDLARVVDALGLLAGSKAWTTADQHGMEDWFAHYLQWLLESENGRDEASQKNNHGTYYDVQAASFALFLGKRDVATNVLQAVGSKRIAVQIEPDGRQPLELARTRAWGYSNGNLRGLMWLGRLGEHVGVDLWNFETPDGRCIRKALDFLTPFALGEQKWPYQQLGEWQPNTLVPSLRWAAARYTDPKYRLLLSRFSEDPADRSHLFDPNPETRSLPRK